MKYLQTIILFLLSTLLFGQSYDPKTTIVGKWTMVKHTLIENGRTEDKYNSDVEITYEFKADGTYQLTSSFKYQGKWDTIVTVGKWKISSESRSIELFENKFQPPHDKDGISVDHPLVIKKLTKSHFVTEEYWFSELTSGTSTYKKQ